MTQERQNNLAFLAPEAIAAVSGPARQKALARFAETGLPTPREESWRFTNLKDLAKHRFTLAQTTALPIPPPLLPQARQIVFIANKVQGKIDATTPDPEAKPSLSALAALNAAFAETGVTLDVTGEDNTPIELLFLYPPQEKAAALHFRHRLTVKAGTKATLIERHLGLDKAPQLITHHLTLTLETDATLTHLRFQECGEHTTLLTELNGTLAARAHYANYALSSGGQLWRNEINIRLAGEGASVILDGAYRLTGVQHGDTTTRIEHMAPHCQSREVYKGAIDDHGRGVFQGKIIVHPGAQKTDGHQLNQALLLSDTAEINAKPELEIYADDVKCSHGATVGDLDETALFYLRSRGLEPPTARALLIHSFLSSPFAEMTDMALKSLMLTTLDRWLGTDALAVAA